MGGKSSDDGETRTVSEPWAGIQPYLIGGGRSAGVGGQGGGQGGGSDGGGFGGFGSLLNPLGFNLPGQGNTPLERGASFLTPLSSQLRDRGDRFGVSYDGNTGQLFDSTSNLLNQGDLRNFADTLNPNPDYQGYFDLPGASLDGHRLLIDAQGNIVSGTNGSGLTDPFGNVNTPGVQQLAFNGQNVTNTSGGAPGFGTYGGSGGSSFSGVNGGAPGGGAPGGAFGGGSAFAGGNAAPPIAPGTFGPQGGGRTFGDDGSGNIIGVLPAAEDIYRNGPSMAPGTDPLTTLGENSQVGYANNFGSLISPYADATGQSLMGGGMPQSEQYTQALNQSLNAPNLDQNPAVQQLMAANNQQISEQLTERILPSLRGGFTNAGQYGSSRQGIAEGQATEGALEAMGQSNAGILNSAYGQGLQQQRAALGLSNDTRSQDLSQQRAAMTLMPQMLNAGLMPGNILQGVGDQRSQQELLQRMDPYERLRYYNAMVTGNPAASFGSSTQTGDRGGNGLLQGAIGGASVGSTFGWPGAAAGGILGGLLSL